MILVYSTKSIVMVTCEDERELDAFATFLRNSYAGDITEHSGDVAEYLAMTFDFRTRGEVRVTIKKLIDDIIAGCGVTAERSTPSTNSSTLLAFVPIVWPLSKLLTSFYS